MAKANHAAMRSGLLRDVGGWLGLSALIIVLDQASKQAILGSIEPGHRVEVLEPVFSLVLTYNPGAAFSLLAAESGWQRYFFILVALAASAFIVYMMGRNKADRFLCFALALVLGGAIGNLLDRILHGAVVDFLLFRWPGGPALFDPWPAFNLADSCISVGAALLIWDSFRRSKVKSTEANP
jgi:signal peptidase II